MGMKTLSKQLSKLDLYGQTAKIEYVYRSKKGACITLLVFLIIIAYGLFNMNYELNKPYEWDIKKIVKRDQSEHTIYPYEKYDMLTGISLVKSDKNEAVKLDPKYGRFVIDYEDKFFWPTTDCYDASGPQTS